MFLLGNKKSVRHWEWRPASWSNGDGGCSQLQDSPWIMWSQCILPVLCPTLAFSNERDKERDVGLCCWRVSIIHTFTWLKIWERLSHNITDQKQFLNSKDAGISFIEELSFRCVYEYTDKKWWRSIQYRNLWFPSSSGGCLLPFKY